MLEMTDAVRRMTDGMGQVRQSGESVGRLVLTAIFSFILGFCAVAAQAHETLASWDGFAGVDDGSTRNGVSLWLQGNEVAADGSITLASQGLKLTRACGTFGNAPSGQTMGVTVIAEVSDVPVPTSGTGGLLSIPISDIAETWSGIDSDGKATISWANNAPSARSGAALGPGTHFVALGYRNNQGSRVFVDGVKVAESSACSGAAWLKSEIHVGEHKTYGSPAIAGVLTGMKILKLAVVNNCLTADEVAAYCANGIGRPDATQRTDYARFVADFSDRVFSWRSTGATFGDGANFGRFNLQSGVDTEVLSGNIVLPGRQEAAPLYRGFGAVYDTAQFNGYTAPGLVLRFPVHGGDYSTSVVAYFPLSLGGLLVEEGAYGATYGNNGALTVLPVSLNSNSADRTTDLGDLSGAVPCWFILHENFALNRKGETKIWGEANFAIDTGKAFDCTTVNAGAVVTLQPGASLVCHGKGTFKVRTLTATAEGVGIDWSNQEIDNAHPFIDGNLQVGSATKLILPAAAKAVKTFTLCSGTVSGDFPRTIQVGDETVESFEFVNNTVILSTVTEYTGVDETSWNTPSAWTDGVPGTGDLARIPAGKTVVVSSSDDLTGVNISGEGRVVYVARQPGSEKSGYCAAAWLGTVEIRNLDLSGESSAVAKTLNFATFSNEKSSIALNGVVSAMWANGSEVCDATFRNLEIGGGGWTSTTDWYSSSPAYRCNLTGTGTLTSLQNESHGTANFIGDHCAFAGSIVNVSGSRQIALLRTGAAPLATHTSGQTGAPQTILVGEGVCVTVAEGKTWQAGRGFNIRGLVGGSGTLRGDVNFSGGAVLVGSGAPTLDGAIGGSPALNAQSVFDTSTFEETKALIATADGRPDFAIQSASGFVAYWRENELWIRDEARTALYTNYAGKGILTWAGTGTLGDRNGGQRYVGFDATTLADTAEVLTELDSWHVFWSGATSGTLYRPGEVLRLARGRGTPQNIDDYVPWSFGGIIVEPGATGYSMTINSGTRDIKLGDQADAAGQSWTMIYENFLVNRGPQGQGTFFGVCNLFVEAGKVFSFNVDTSVKDNPVVHPGAVLKLHGAGTLKVSNLIASDATLDFSNLSASRTTPFVDGDMTISRDTVLAFPDGFDIRQSYRLCSGTLKAPALSFTATVVVNGIDLRKKVSVDGNSVSCSSPDGFSLILR